MKQNRYSRKYSDPKDLGIILIKFLLPVFIITLGIFGILLVTYQRNSIETVNADTNLVSYSFSKYNVTSEMQELNRIEDSTYQFNSSAVLSDRRGYLFDLYFAENNSPLVGTGYLFAAACDAYGAPRDCVSVVAIAKHETDLCKYQYSFEMNNCWGFGGGGEYRRQFNDIGEGIFTVTRVLVQQYGIRYMEDPRLMERVFCGPDPECDNWGTRVLSLMTELRNYARIKGIELN